MATRPAAERPLGNPTSGPRIAVAQELQRIHVEQHDEQQDRVEKRRPRVLQAVATEELVVLPPDVADHREGHGKRDRSAHEIEQGVARLRHLELHDEQRQRKAENGIGESLDTADLLGASLRADGRRRRSGHLLPRDVGRDGGGAAAEDAIDQVGGFESRGAIEGARRPACRRRHGQGEVGRGAIEHLRPNAA